MICSRCGTKNTRVLSTRQADNGTISRVHQCGNGHRFRSRQIFEACYSPARTRSRDYFEMILRRAEYYLRNRKILAALKEGRSREEIGAHFGLTAGAVWWIKKHFKP